MIRCICTEKRTREYCSDFLCYDRIADYEVSADALSEEEILNLYRNICETMIGDGFLLIHGSALEIDGRGILFCAESGTGKSTHTRIWRETFGDRVSMINDDKPLVNAEKLTIHGTPWNGKDRISNDIFSTLDIICFLHRDETNRAEKCADPFPKLLEATYKPKDRELMQKTLTLLDNILNNTEFYDIYVNMEGDAAETVYEEILAKRYIK